MTPYEYYEFRACERALAPQEQQALRERCPGARVTPRRLVQKGPVPDAVALLGGPFDAVVHVAPWGTHRAVVRLPAGTLSPSHVQRYCAGESTQMHRGRGHLLLDFTSEADAPPDWEDGEGWMTSIVRARAALLQRDRRALYLGWLLSAQCGELPGDAQEPPVPRDLARLSPALQRFAAFLRIDEDMLWVAADRCPVRRTAGELLGTARLLQHECQIMANLRSARAAARKELMAPLPDADRRG